MIAVKKEHTVVMLEAGYVYLAMSRFKEAKEVFEGVVALAPKHEVPLVALANVFFAQAKFLESVRTLKNAVKINPDSSFAWAHLGESQLFYGKRDEAKEALEKSVELESQGKTADFAKSLLKLMEEGYDPKTLRKEMKEKIKEAEQEKKTGEE
jgi:predicted Zn-dependent protease